VYRGLGVRAVWGKSAPMGRPRTGPSHEKLIAGPGNWSRPRAVHEQRVQSTYLFGAVCPERGIGAALVLPACNCEAMQLHRDEIATKVAPGAHAILLLDQARWHGAKALVVPSNVSLVPLPRRAPELNGQENIWQTVCSFLDGGRGGSSTL